MVIMDYELKNMVNFVPEIKKKQTKNHSTYFLHSSPPCNNGREKIKNLSPSKAVLFLNVTFIS